LSGWWQWPKPSGYIPSDMAAWRWISMTVGCHTCLDEMIARNVILKWVYGFNG